ncbi:hypothetical protein KJ969_04815 [Patescibacteria group bacterium]|nr:hypothetical protein [Patescibacteria group bacterium]MBU1921808.1 hypothetical protein [Patescibacteria group bacterium]
MLEKKILSSTRLALFVVSGLIILLAVFLVGLYWGQNADRDIYQQGYNSAWQRAADLIDRLGVFAPEQDEIFTIKGTVADKKTNGITLSAEPETDNPFADQGPLERSVTIDANTQIFKRTTKSDQEFESEMEQYLQKISQAGDEEDVANPPTDYAEQAIDFDDIEEGDAVSVTALENIKGVEEFVASKIYILVEPATEEEE